MKIDFRHTDFFTFAFVAYLGFLFCFCQGRAVAQVVEIPNGQFQLDGPTIHQQSAKPIQWKVESRSRKNVVVWDAPDSSAIAIRKTAMLSQSFPIVPLNEKLAGAGKWDLVVSVDVLGRSKTSSKRSRLKMSLNGSGKNLGEAQTDVDFTADLSKRSQLFFTASSFQRGNGNTEFAFDSDPATIWHSNYGKNHPKHPHFLALDFGKSMRVKGLRYVPRKNLGNGTIKEFEVQSSSDFENWRTVFAGEFSYNDGQFEQDVVFPKTIKCRAIRLVAHSSWRGDPFATCAELTPDVQGGFDKLLERSTTPGSAQKFERLFLRADVDAKSGLKLAQLSLTADSDDFIVLDNVSAMWVPNIATMKMRGKANGHLGPDLLGAGSYGFDGLMIHNYQAIPLISVHPDSPAATAGLQPTDLIVGIDGQFLPPGNVAPGFEWFESSHEALLGRAAVKAVSSSGSKATILNVLRDGKIVDLQIIFDLPDEIAHDDFLINPNKIEALNKDLIAQVLKTQTKNGSWKNSPIHTALGGLALLSTGEQKFAPQIKAAADWAMQRHAQPDTGFYWLPSFSGIFLCEYFLATGDRRVIPVVSRMLRMMSSAFHTSKWGTKTFGHGPRGLPYGNKSLVAVMVHVLVFEELAKRCGIESEIYEVLAPFIESAWSDPSQGGHGGLGYNASYKDRAEFWSRSGIFGLALHLKKQRQDMQNAMAKIMHRRHPWFRNSHAYGEPGGLLGFIGLSQVDQTLYEETLSRYRWWFAMAWRKGQGLHFTIPHMGAPYMEGPVLINNGYAIVSNIHKKNLFISGATKKNWLNVSGLPHPLSDALILEQPNGLIELRTKIPGSKIVYTTDGSEPTNQSFVYSRPFRVEPGTVVKARAMGDGTAGNIAVRGFGFDKSKWRIVSATGFENNQFSLSRAAFAIDGDKHIGWVPNVGEGSTGLPHEMVIDLGSANNVAMAGIRFMLEGGAAKKVIVSGRKSANAKWKNIGSATFANFQADNNIPLQSKSKIRFVKFEFLSPGVAPSQKLLMLGEIDIR